MRLRRRRARPGLRVWRAGDAASDGRSRSRRPRRRGRRSRTSEACRRVKCRPCNDRTRAADHAWRRAPRRDRLTRAAARHGRRPGRDHAHRRRRTGRQRRGVGTGAGRGCAFRRQARRGCGRRARHARARRARRGGRSDDVSVHLLVRRLAATAAPARDGLAHDELACRILAALADETRIRAQLPCPRRDVGGLSACAGACGRDLVVSRARAARRTTITSRSRSPSVVIRTSTIVAWTALRAAAGFARSRSAGLSAPPVRSRLSAAAPHRRARTRDCARRAVAFEDAPCFFEFARRAGTALPRRVRHGHRAVEPDVALGHEVRRGRHVQDARQPPCERAAGTRRAGPGRGT